MHRTTAEFGLKLEKQLALVKHNELDRGTLGSGHFTILLLYHSLWVKNSLNGLLQ